MSELRPKLSVMTREQIDKTHQDALSILEQTGVVVHEPGARNLLKRNIGKTCEDDRIRIPRDLVQWAIAAAPSDIRIYDRMGTPCFDLTGDGSQDTVFGIG